MGAIGNLVPLVILFAVVASMGWVGYQVLTSPSHSSPPFPPPLLHQFSPLTARPPHQIFLYSNELAERGVRKMEKKNVVFSKDGAKVAVKEVRPEDYADRTQKAFVKTWNAAQGGTSGAEAKAKGGKARTK
jgi:hypothetical protein